MFNYREIRVFNFFDTKSENSTTKELRYKTMNEWIPFEDATYMAERAFVVASDQSAAALEQAYITVYTGKGGKRYLKGGAQVRNILLVELLEENDDLDLILDFGGEFKYRLATPKINAGKVFAADVTSSLTFSPIAPWHQIPEPEFEALLNQLKVL